MFRSIGLILYGFIKKFGITILINSDKILTKIRTNVI